MPTYVYECRVCGKGLEAWQSIKDAPLTDCPEGHPGALKRVIQPVGIAFRGSGFYVTDSAPAPAPSEKAEKTETKAEEKPAETAKPAEATPTPAASADS